MKSNSVCWIWSAPVIPLNCRSAPLFQDHRLQCNHNIKRLLCASLALCMDWAWEFWWPTVIFAGTGSFPGHETFSTKHRTVPGKLGQLVT